MPEHVHRTVTAFLTDNAPFDETPEQLRNADIELHISATGEWLYVEHLFVPPENRRQNHAKTTLEAILAFATQEGYNHVHAKVRLTGDWDEIPFGSERHDDPTLQLLSDCGFGNFRIKRSDNDPDAYAVNCSHPVIPLGSNHGGRV